jgi:hypothetical protein
MSLPSMRVHAVAVVLDLVDPPGVRRRFFDQARQLDPFCGPIRSSHDGHCSRFRLTRKGVRKAFLLPFRHDWCVGSLCKATVARGMEAGYSSATTTC